MRFSTRNRIILPTGITVESIRSRINVVVANQAKVNRLTPYVREARIRADMGCIFLTLAAQAADTV